MTLYIEHKQIDNIRDYLCKPGCKQCELSITIHENKGSVCHTEYISMVCHLVDTDNLELCMHIIHHNPYALRIGKLCPLRYAIMSRADRCAAYILNIKYVEINKYVLSDACVNGMTNTVAGLLKRNAVFTFINDQSWLLESTIQKYMYGFHVMMVLQHRPTTKCDDVMIYVNNALDELKCRVHDFTGITYDVCGIITGYHFGYNRH